MDSKVSAFVLLICFTAITYGQTEVQTAVDGVFSNGRTVRAHADNSIKDQVDAVDACLEGITPTGIM